MHHIHDQKALQVVLMIQYVVPACHRCIQRLIHEKTQSKCVIDPIRARTKVGGVVKECCYVGYYAKQPKYPLPL